MIILNNFGFLLFHLLTIQLAPSTISPLSKDIKESTTKHSVFFHREKVENETIITAKMKLFDICVWWCYYCSLFDIKESIETSLCCMQIDSFCLNTFVSFWIEMGKVFSICRTLISIPKRYTKTNRRNNLYFKMSVMSDIRRRKKIQYTLNGNRLLCAFLSMIKVVSEFSRHHIMLYV